jgi:hypothetical protein
VFTSKPKWKLPTVSSCLPSRDTFMPRSRSRHQRWA